MDFLKAIAGLIGLADLWSKYFVKKDDQNTGRILQTADNLKETVKHDQVAIKTGEDARRLDDTALDDELRKDATGANR